MAPASTPPPTVTPADLRRLARERLNDARILLTNHRYDGAYYLCGYAVEMLLKARICRTLKWPEFGGEHVKALKVHDLAFLLKFSGAEPRVKAKYMAEWSRVQDWRVENRYDPKKTINVTEATDMIDATARLLRVL